jgi:uncharacterized coiled-coil protein SlyX
MNTLNRRQEILLNRLRERLKSAFQTQWMLTLNEVMSDHIRDGERYQKRLASKKRWRDKNKAYIKAYYYWYHWTVTKPGIIQVDRPNIKDFK